MARKSRHSALVDALVMRLGAWRMAHRPALDVRPDAGGRTWYRIENRDGGSGGNGPAVLMIYDEIGAWGVTADMFMSDLAGVGSRDLLLRINSPGGEVFDGVAIYNALSRHAGRITGHVDGLAASAASFIAMAADELVMEPGSQLMIHDAQGMCWGNEADAIALAGMLGRTSNTIAMIYAERTGEGDAESWRELMRAETWYEGEAAVTAKLADRVGDSRAREREDGPVNRVEVEPVAEPAPDGRPPVVLASGTERRVPERRPLAFRSRPALGLPQNIGHEDQPRDDDGRWSEMPGTGMSWDDYASSYDVYGESSTASGLTVVTMTNREMQFAFDDADEPGVRHALLDFAEDDNGPVELRDALREAIDSEVITDFELVEPDGSGIWANVTRNAESITLFIPGSVERNDFEIEIDLDEAEELITVIDAQIDQYNELQFVDAWTVPVWASAPSTSDPVSSRTDDLQDIGNDQSLWEAWV